MPRVTSATRISMRIRSASVKGWIYCSLKQVCFHGVDVAALESLTENRHCTAWGRWGSMYASNSLQRLQERLNVSQKLDGTGSAHSVDLPAQPSTPRF